MTITVGISQTADKNYIKELFNNGTREFFAGFVPKKWYNKYGFEVSPNFRFIPEAQFLDYNIMKEYVNFIHALGAKIFITLNEHYYTNEQLPLIEEIFEAMENINVDGYIVADVALILFLKSLKEDINLCLSGEAGIYNSEAIEFFNQFNIKRIILPQGLTFNEIKKLVNKANGLNIDCETFIIGDRCIFRSAYCFTSHGYNGVSKEFCKAIINESKLIKNGNINSITIKMPNSQQYTKLNQLIGKCGICFINQLRDIGIKFLKVPGRGRNVLSRVKLLNKILNINKDTNFLKSKLNCFTFCEINCIF